MRYALSFLTATALCAIVGAYASFFALPCVYLIEGPCQFQKGEQCTCENGTPGSRDKIGEPLRSRTLCSCKNSNCGGYDPDGCNQRIRWEGTLEEWACMSGDDPCDDIDDCWKASPPPQAVVLNETCDGGLCQSACPVPSPFGP